MSLFMRNALSQDDLADDLRLDHVARRLSASLTRRRAYGVLGGSALGAALAGLGISGAVAACRRKGKKCRRDGQCCSGRCVRKKCRRERGSGDTPPATDYRQRVLVTGTVDIIDHETFGSNERCTHSVDVDTGPLTGADPLFASELAWGCGGEVRIELNLDFALRDNGDVGVSGRVDLFEGTSESTTDLDGEESIAEFIVPRGSSVVKDVTVRNEREGGDFANLRLTFRNIAA